VVVAFVVVVVVVMGQFGGAEGRSFMSSNLPPVH
jgi:hypothetical protein